MKFKKKPVVIDAIQFTGNNLRDVLNFGQNTCIRCPAPQDPVEYIAIDTLEGIMRADINDWIIKGVKGEFYPCKPDIFATTYEAIE